MKIKRIIATSLTIFMMSNVFMAKATGSSYDVTINNIPANTGVTISEKEFSAYQILDRSTSGSEQIASSFTQFFTDNSATSYNYAIDYLADSTDADVLVEEIMEYISDNNITATKTQAVATDNESVVLGLTNGYYLITDTTNASSDTDTDTDNYDRAYSMLVDVTKNVNINIKMSAPTVNKEVWHDDKNGSGEWDIVADNQIGETVYYKITSTIPTDITGYDSYTYILSDTMTDGISYNGDVTIYTSEGDDDQDLKNAEPLSKDYYKITENDTPNTSTAGNIKIFEITVDILKMNEEIPDITTIYTHYSGIVEEHINVSDEKETNTITLTHSNNPHKEDSISKKEDSVYNYAFSLNILKEDENQAPLANVGFQLYNGTEQIRLTKGATIDKYDIYYVAKDQPTDIDSDDTITTNADGLFKILGLDDATEYTLKETATPVGYYGIDDMDFTITASYDVDGEISDLTVDNADLTASTTGLSATIVNTTSKKLPSTGGMGTTIFHISGGALLLLAVILFVKNKKTNKN